MNYRDELRKFFDETWEEPASAEEEEQPCEVPRKSVVRVRFSDCDLPLSYYNDRFCLKPGDLVYVEGQQEKQPGRVEAVSYQFKIKPSRYKRVLVRCDTRVSGRFHPIQEHFVSFDPAVLPPSQVSGWLVPPDPEEESFVLSTDDSSIPLDDPALWGFRPAIADRGRQYYRAGCVSYLRLEGEKGFAIVRGGENYTVEFCYTDGQIRELLCDCPCCEPCKHAYAVLLQLRELLEQVRAGYAEDYAQSSCFTAIARPILTEFVLATRASGSFLL